MNAGGVLDETVDKEMKQSPKDEDDGIRYAVTTAIVHDDGHMDKTKIQQEEVDLQTGLLNEGNVIGSEPDPEPAVEKYTAIDIFRYPRVLRVSLILWFTWYLS